MTADLVRRLRGADTDNLRGDAYWMAIYEQRREAADLLERVVKVLRPYRGDPDARDLIKEIEGK